MPEGGDRRHICRAFEHRMRVCRITSDAPSYAAEGRFNVQLSALRVDTRHATPTRERIWTSLIRRVTQRVHQCPSRGRRRR